MTIAKQSQWRPNPRAFTLAELMLALSLAGLVGAAVLSMLSAFGSASSPRFSVRGPMVDRQVAALRVGAMLRSSARVLGASSDRVVLWIGDANADGVPSLSELRLVEYRRPSGEVWAFGVPASPSEPVYSLNSDFVSMVGGVAGDASFPGQVMLTGDTDWVLSFDTPDPKDARLVRVQITTQSDDGPSESKIVAGLRCSPNS
jgi:hypothetical protein